MFQHSVITKIDQLREKVIVAVGDFTNDNPL